MNKILPTLILLFLSNLGHSYATKHLTTTPKQLSYDGLMSKVHEHKKDTAKAMAYAKTWLSKAKKEKNYTQQSTAYKSIMHLVEKKYRMIYADSLQLAALQSNDDLTIGQAYLTVGAAHYQNNELTKALDFYILASKHLEATSDEYLQHKLLFTIAQTKYYLGFYEEAILAFLKCIPYFQSVNESAYIKSIHALSLCYIQTERYDLSTYYNQLGRTFMLESDQWEMEPYFKKATGINQYHRKQYEEAITNITAALTGLQHQNDSANQTIGWFFLAKCYWETHKKKKAVTLLTKVLTAMESNQLFRPDLRETFEILIKYYEDNKDKSQQLEIIEKLLAYDSKLTQNYKYLTYKIHKEYDTASLLLKKNKIKSELDFNKMAWRYTSLIFGIFSIATVMMFGYYKRKNKKIFQNYMQNLKTGKTNPPPAIPTPKTNISPELTETLIHQLEIFEHKHKYLEKEMSLSKLASILNTNTKYASNIIAIHRGKKTIQYINDLRIDYLIGQLIKYPKYRHYTNKALADEVGFGSTQIFTKSFKNKTGMSPTTFINQIAKDPHTMT